MTVEPSTDPLAGRRVVLGVTGSIAAHKALTVASRLVQAGAEVDVILTDAAASLIRPLAFAALTHRPVVTSLWDPAGPMAMDHIALAQAADVLLVAPATADIVAKLSLGLADDALTTTALATRAPLIVAPAMEPDMWSHAATRWHADTLTARGALLVGPVEGRMASGKQGLGRLAEPDEIVDWVRVVLGRTGPLAGRRVLVSAGPTREALDPVRYLSNHSSGRMGYAIARALRDRGAAVTLVTGPVTLTPPVGVEVVAVETAVEMRDAVLARASGVDAVDVVVMTAAVADYRPATVSEIKIKKGDEDTVLRLTRNPDILRALDAVLRDLPPEQRPLRVGFAAETDDLEANARAKLGGKGVDLVVANPVPATFGSERGTALFVDASGVRELGDRTKVEIAGEIAEWLAAALAARGAGGRAQSEGQEKRPGL